MLLPHMASKSNSSKTFDPDWEYFWEDEFIVMTDRQRYIFGAIAIVITLIGIIGNLLTIAMCFFREQRILFKFCLMSLSVSDLVSKINNLNGL